MRTRSKGSCGVFLYVFLLLFGMLYLWVTLSDKQQAEEAVNWPATSGEISQSYIDTEIDNEGDRTYRAVVNYQYNVDGVSYTNGRLHFGPRNTYNSQSKASEFLSEYPVGASVTVFYDPEKPTEAVLDIEPQNITVGIVIGGVLTLAGVVGMVVFAVKALMVR